MSYQKTFRRRSSCSESPYTEARAGNVKLLPCGMSWQGGAGKSGEAPDVHEVRVWVEAWTLKVYRHYCLFRLPSKSRVVRTLKKGSYSAQCGF